MSDYVFSHKDVTVMVALVAKHDPDEFPHSDAKSMIYRCRSLVDESNAKGNVEITILGQP